MEALKTQKVKYKLKKKRLIIPIYVKYNKVLPGFLLLEVCLRSNRIVNKFLAKLLSL